MTELILAIGDWLDRRYARRRFAALLLAGGTVTLPANLRRGFGGRGRRA